MVYVSHGNHWQKTTTDMETQIRKSFWNFLGFEYEPKSGGPKQNSTTGGSPRAH